MSEAPSPSANKSHHGPSGLLPKEFHKQGKSKDKGPDSELVQLSRDVSEVLSRLRLLEERYANIRREHQISAHNMVENHQGLSKQIRRLNDSLLEVKRSFAEVTDEMKSMQTELADAAKSYDIKVLQRYVDLWEPVNFITREQAERMIREALEKLNSE